MAIIPEARLNVEIKGKLGLLVIFFELYQSNI